nr:DciA family protein [Streptomyces durbertensis]
MTGGPAENSGPTGPGVPESTGLDLARVALFAAKERARERGELSRQREQVRRGGGPRSGARRDGRDPLPLGAAIERLKTERGWEMPMAVGGVAGRWPEIVGGKNAEHWQPAGYDEESRVLRVRCDTAAWATELRRLAPVLVRRLNEELGNGTVLAIEVLAPGSGRGRGGPGSPGRPQRRW